MSEKKFRYLISKYNFRWENISDSLFSMTYSGKSEKSKIVLDQAQKKTPRDEILKINFTNSLIDYFLHTHTYQETPHAY